MGTVRWVAEPAAGSKFEDVYQAEFAGVVRLALLLVGSWAVAEELAQDAFLRLYQHFEAVENPPGFLRTAVVRLASTWLHRSGMERARLARVGVERPVDAPQVDEMWQALGRLRPERRVVLVLRFYEQMRHREVADVLGCSPATVRSRTRRALQDLRRELGE